MAAPAVGCRVRILKDYATVLYIGPVAQQEGTWVGVEWDDPSRGKHDGSTAGVRYFDCKSGTTSGSFVRMERVCFGISLLQALRARYNNETAEHGEEVSADELYVHTLRKRRVQVQMIGEEKIQQRQRQIHALESARLVGMDVSFVGDASELCSALPALTSLDVTSNLVAQWAFVETLALALPSLAVLNLSENKLQIPPPLEPPAPLLPGIRALVLNDCGVTWHDVLRVAPSLPSLEELHLCGNPIGSLEPAAAVAPAPAAAAAVAPPPAAAAVAPAPEAAAATTTSEGRGEEGRGEQPGGSSGRGGDDETAAELLASLFPRLQVLTLEEAQLSGWPTLELLRRLPALTRLHLAGNPNITTIRYPIDPGAADPGAAGSSSAPPTALPPQPGEPQQHGQEAATAAAAGASGEAAAAAAASGGAEGPAADAPAASAASAASAAPAAPAAAFPRLAALFLGGCGVADWSSVNQLDTFPELRELRLTGNPVLALSKTGGRFEVIGRVSRLRQLNGAEVRPRERRDSELRYLQHVASEMEAAGADESRRADVRAAHPRLRRLVEVHGTVLATASRGGPGSGSLAASMVELRLTCVAAAAHAKMGTQVKKLPRSTTVSALRLLCERLFKVKSDQMALFIRAPGDPLPENIGAADQEDRQLGFFGVQDGYEVLVDEADPEALKRADEDARAAAAAAHEQRLAEQLRAADNLQAEFARNMGLQQQQQQQ